MKAKIGRGLLFILSAGTLLLTSLLTSCRQTAPAVNPRQALVVSEVESIASEFDSVMTTYWKTCRSRDLNTVRQLYTEDIVLHDINDDIIKGPMLVSGTYCSTYAMAFPNFEAQPVANYVDGNDGVYIQNSWGWSVVGAIPGDYFSETNPMVNYMWITIRDGKIARMWMFYGQEVFAALASTPFPSQLLEKYADVWSSGKPQKVADLYTADAVYMDSLFGDNIQGAEAIKEFTSRFFAWYPDIQLTLGKSFGDYSKADVIGGLYSLRVSDQKGKDCDIQALMILNTDAHTQKIKEEWIFYKADSLIACGWAQ